MVRRVFYILLAVQITLLVALAVGVMIYATNQSASATEQPSIQQPGAGSGSFPPPSGPQNQPGTGIDGTIPASGTTTPQSPTTALQQPDSVFPRESGDTVPFQPPSDTRFQNPQDAPDTRSPGIGVPGAEVTNPASGDQVFCTQDVQECPDGSFVSRQPPNCEFAPCPGE